jgi:hypothetical protein
MGREIRRVPPNWEHPTVKKYNPWSHREEENFQPLYNEPYGPAMARWIEEHQLWERGEHPAQKDGSGKEYRYYAQWGGGPPDVEYYRPDWKQEEMTWWQVYETVSEGTPVTPPFATREELVEYLVANGDYWDQKRRKEGRSLMPCEPWTRKQAESFVFGAGWAPSLIVTGGRVMSGVEAMADYSANNPI